MALDVWWRKWGSDIAVILLGMLGQCWKGLPQIPVVIMKKYYEIVTTR